MGYLQDEIIKIGKEKGFVTSLDVARFYQQSKIEVEMNKLVALGYFEQPEDCITFIKWKFIKNDRI
jgi:hypothetical protein